MSFIKHVQEISPQIRVVSRSGTNPSHLENEHFIASWYHQVRSMNSDHNASGSQWTLNVLLSHCKNLGDQRERFWISNVGKKFFPPTFIFGRTGLLEAEALLTNSCFTCSHNFLKNFKFYFNPQKQFPIRSLNWSLGTNHCNGVHTRSTPLPASNSNHITFEIKSNPIS